MAVVRIVDKPPSGAIHRLLKSQPDSAAAAMLQKRRERAGEPSGNDEAVATSSLYRHTVLDVATFAS
jgi:hypothetical protein